MRYVLVGNGNIVDETLFTNGNAHFIQMNLCRHIHLLPRDAKTSIFITNTGPSAGRIADVLCNAAIIKARKPTFVLARDEAFYTAKRRLLRLRGCSDFVFFSVEHSVHRTLAGSFNVQAVALDESLDLDLLLCQRGMPPNFMPSTGMIAYHWIRRRIGPSDAVAVTGFSHEGWDHHPWDLEREYIKDITPVAASPRDPGGSENDGWAATTGSGARQAFR